MKGNANPVLQFSLKQAGPLEQTLHVLRQASLKSMRAKAE